MQPIQVREGDLLAVEHGIIVHGCNAQGTMGQGVAKLIRRKWPQAYEDFRALWLARGRKLELGTVQLVPIRYAIARPNEPELVVANAVTQRSFGNDGRRYVDYEAISECFMELARWSRELALPLHFPLIGCGLGGGQWPEVRRRIEAAAPGACKLLWVLPGQRPPEG